MNESNTSRRARHASAKPGGRSTAALLAAAVCIAVSPVRAALYYWDPTLSNTDPGSGGTGTWNTTSAFWKKQSTLGDVVWPNTSNDTADFEGTAGTVTLGSAITAGQLYFNTAGYTINTSTFALTLGTGGITANPATGTTTINGGLTLGGAQTWTVTAGGTLAVAANVANGGFTLTTSGAGATSIGGAISGNGGLTNTATGVVTLSGANGYSGATTLTTAGSILAVQNAGSTTNGATNNALGTSAISIGAAATTATLRLRNDGAGGTTAGTVTYGNNVTVTGTSGLATIDVNQITTNVTNKTLQLGTLSIGAQTLNVTGGNGYALHSARPH